MLIPAKGYFIAGTDTGIGKTTFAVKLLTQLKQQGLRTVAIKPVASGCEQSSEGLVNQDALLLQQHATEQLNYHDVNPITIEAPISPNLAPTPPHVAQTYQACQNALNTIYDRVIVEGSGGWLTPLNEYETMADLAVCFGFPIILVIGIRLGCLNHSLLTIESIQQNDMLIAGWVANCITPGMPYETENIDFLAEKLQLQPILL